MRTRRCRFTSPTRHAPAFAVVSFGLRAGVPTPPGPPVGSVPRPWGELPLSAAAPGGGKDAGNGARPDGVFGSTIASGVGGCSPGVDAGDMSPLVVRSKPTGGCFIERRTRAAGVSGGDCAGGGAGDEKTPPALLLVAPPPAAAVPSALPSPPPSARKQIASAVAGAKAAAAAATGPAPAAAAAAPAEAEPAVSVLHVRAPGLVLLPALALEVGVDAATAAAEVFGPCLSQM
mmetsp:Transcript_103633/g.332150  ORF Transcript_103633/g.332150 Transcript_103633/m.332150 type:complete len:232 (+) Transcript_103633:2407-3102(+)